MRPEPPNPCGEWRRANGARDASIPDPSLQPQSRDDQDRLIYYPKHTHTPNYALRRGRIWYLI